MYKTNAREHFATRENLILENVPEAKSKDAGEGIRELSGQKGCGNNVSKVRMPECGRGSSSRLSDKQLDYLGVISCSYTPAPLEVEIRLRRFLSWSGEALSSGYFQDLRRFGTFRGFRLYSLEPAEGF